MRYYTWMNLTCYLGLFHELLFKLEVFGEEVSALALMNNTLR